MVPSGRHQPLLVGLVLLGLVRLSIQDGTYRGASLSSLTPWNFEEVIGGEKNVLAIFHMPDCGGCKKFMPKFEETAVMLHSLQNDTKFPLEVMKADATEFEYNELKDRLKVTQVPAVKLFKKGSQTPIHLPPSEPFDLHFKVKEAMGMPIPNKCLFGESDAEDITPDTWDAKVMDPDRSVLVEFYAPWCPHCKRFTSVYNGIARKALNMPGIRVVRVDIDKHKSLGERYGVKLLPTLMIFSKKNKNGTKYELPDESEYLQMSDKTLAALSAPESDPEMEAEAKQVLQRIRQAQKNRDMAGVVDEIEAASVELNITKVWKESIEPIRLQQREVAALRLKDKASGRAGDGKEGCMEALELLKEMRAKYPDTRVATSDGAENLEANCRHMVAA